MGDSSEKEKQRREEWLGNLRTLSEKTNLSPEVERALDLVWPTLHGHEPQDPEEQQKIRAAREVLEKWRLSPEGYAWQAATRELAQEAQRGADWAREPDLPWAVAFFLAISPRSRLARLVLISVLGCLAWYFLSVASWMRDAWQVEGLSVPWYVVVHSILCFGLAVLSVLLSLGIFLMLGKRKGCQPE